jgi:CHASE2 domain-containing sensor protein
VRVQNRKPRPPRTPLLLVLLGSAVLVGTISYVAAHVTLWMNVVEPLVMTTLVAAVGGTRIFMR